MNIKIFLELRRLLQLKAYKVLSKLKFRSDLSAISKKWHELILLVKRFSYLVERSELEKSKELFLILKENKPFCKLIMESNDCSKKMECTALGIQVEICLKMLCSLIKCK